MAQQIDYEKLHMLLQVHRMVSGTPHHALLQAIAAEIAELDRDAAENARAAEAKVA